MWPLTLTRSVTFNATLNASTDAVLRILHDPNSFISLNPLVSKVSNDSADPSIYVITDDLVVMGYFHAETTYRCSFTFREDGVDSEVVAGMGTKTNSSFRVQAGENGTTLISEQTTIQSLFLFMPFILKTMAAGHVALLKNLGKKAETVPSRHVVDVITIMPTSLPTIAWFAIVLLLILGNQTLFSRIHYTFYIALLVGILSIAYARNTTKDPYGLFHLALNYVPGDDLNKPPKTEWLNMGFWKDTDTFPVACAALARKLIQAANCKKGGRVLDVGHGTGDSLLLLLADPSIRPSSLTGITSLPAHHHRSRDRAERLVSSLEDPKPQVMLHAVDALYQPTCQDHPLDPHSAHNFDTILVLDCAYHFNTRKAFLQQSFKKLAPGGRVALADICFSSSNLGSYRTRLITSLLRLMPRENLVSVEGYVSDMQEMNYVDVQLEDITENVFPGFIRFLKGRGWGWWVFGSTMELYANAGARFVIVSGSRA